MTNVPEALPPDIDVNKKLKLLKEIIGDLVVQSPSELRSLLADYKEFFFDIVSDNSHIPATNVASSSEDDNNLQSSHWNCSDIAEDVACIAKKAMVEAGVFYDENSGWYYDEKMKCYYDPNYRLYYSREHNSYYYYDEETKSLKYYCSVSSETNQQKIDSCPFSDNNIGLKPDSGYIAKDHSSKFHKEVKRSLENIPHINEEKEEGECSSSDEDCPTDTKQEEASLPTPAVIEAGPTPFEPDHSKHIAPCIRVIVISSTLPNLSLGTLFIVTCTGGTLGREGDHDVLIPDTLVSKMHSKFQYVYKNGEYAYEIIDLGSKNGTYLNGYRMSNPLMESDPFTVFHGTIITVGTTELLCHIHPNDERCSECESFNVCIKGDRRVPEMNLTLKEKYNIEASIIKKKFGIENFVNTKFPKGYEDRAGIRRKEVGSSHSSEKTEMSSVDVPIGKSNKGYSLLSKMGWTDGETLGKRNEGALEPVTVESKRALGCTSIYPYVGESKKSAIAKKTLERYKQAKDSGEHYRSTLGLSWFNQYQMLPCFCQPGRIWWPECNTYHTISSVERLNYISFAPNPCGTSWL